MGLGEAIENAIRKLVDYCYRKDVRCKNCPFVSKDNKCDLNMSILEDLVHFTDAEIIPTKENAENLKKAYENVAALEISADIDTPSRYQTSDGEWHEGMIGGDEMDVLLIDLKNGYPQPWLNGKKLERCREIKIEKYTDYEEYTLNGNTVIRIRGKFQFENGILSEVKDGD